MSENTNDVEKTRKPKFDLSNAVNADGPIALDEKDRLTAIPTNWSPEYRRLQRSSFADKGHYFEWLASLEAAKIARIQERIEELEEAAEEARRGPDPTRQNAKKLARMLKNAAALQAQLEAEGVDLSEFGIGEDE